MSNYIILNFVFETSEYVFSRKEEINKFPFVTLHQSLPPPPFPWGFSGVVLCIDMNILYYLPVKMYQTQCDLSDEVLLDLE